MQFTIRQLLTCTVAIAVYFGVRSSSVTSSSPEHELLIPLSVASLTAAYLGWARRSPSVSGLYAAAIALLSCAALSVEVALGLPPTGFLRALPINVFAVTIVTMLCWVTGVAVSFLFASGRRFTLQLFGCD